MHPFAARALSALLVVCTLLISPGIPSASAEPSGPPRLYLPLVFRAETAPITLVAMADATIYQGTPDVNRGTEYFLFAGNDQPVETGLGILRSLVRFELPSEVARVVSSATLRIYYTAYWDYPDKTRTVHVEAAKEPWSETTVTWANQPERLPTIYGSAGINRDEPFGYRDIDVTGLVQGWVDGTIPNYGLYLMGPEVGGSDASYRVFFSRETLASDKPYPPQLVIRF